MSATNTVQNAVRDLLTNDLPTGMVYHNLKHTEETAAYAEKIASKTDNLSEDEQEDIVLAAWLHDIGYTQTSEDHEEESIRLGEQVLKEAGLTAERTQSVLRLIRSTKSDIEPMSPGEKVLYDADNINIGRKRFFEKSALLRREWETVLGNKLPDTEWEQMQLEYLEKHRFQTPYANKKWGPRRVKNIEKQLNNIKKEKKQDLKAKKPGRGVETMYRSIYRSHIDLSAIADSKANMMISINTIMVSIVVAAIGSGFTFTGRSFIEHVRFTIPMCVLVVGGLVSIVFAILSASPSVTSKKVTRKRLQRKKASSLFFGNFTTIERDEFVNTIADLRHVSEEIYNSMSVDIYDLGTVLRKKYRFLKISYLAFMFSLILTVITFLVLLLFSW